MLHRSRSGSHPRSRAALFPLQIQVCLNGHEWLARKLTARGIEHTKTDNGFARNDDLPRAQRLCDRIARLKGPQILNRYARQVVPQLEGMLCDCEYDWVAAQAEHATDVMFKAVQRCLGAARLRAVSRQATTARARPAAHPDAVDL